MLLITYILFLTALNSTERDVASLLCCSIDTSSRREANDDEHEVGFELTTENGDIYNVYYPVMEAQIVTESNGKTFAVTEFAQRSF
jgi:hypothetical protein